MSWLSKAAGGLFRLTPLGVAVDLLNNNDTEPQASPDPRIPNSRTTSGQVQAVNTGVNQTLGRKR